jgi:hypothetical protein
MGSALPKLGSREMGFHSKKSNVLGTKVSQHGVGCRPQLLLRAILFDVIDNNNSSASKGNMVSI